MGVNLLLDWTITYCIKKNSLVAGQNSKTFLLEINTDGERKQVVSAENSALLSVIVQRDSFSLSTRWLAGVRV